MIDFLPQRIHNLDVAEKYRNLLSYLIQMILIKFRSNDITMLLNQRNTENLYEFESSILEETGENG